jgi:hypothetical protein
VNIYIHDDTTYSGFINRGSQAAYSFHSQWKRGTDSPICLELTLGDNYDILELINNKQVDHFHYHRGKRAYNRHKKEAMYYFGYKVPTKKEKPTKKIIYSDSIYNPLKIAEIKVNGKLLPNGNHLSGCKYTDYSEDKAKLVEEYNKIFTEWENKRKEFREKIFESV